MLDVALKTITKYQLIASGDRVLLGVSGGADSTGLMYLLFALSRTLNFSLEVLHVHHGLRGAEADRQAKFVQQMGWKLGLPVHVVKVNTKARAKLDKSSIEMAARSLRHEAVKAVMNSGDFAAVALGHTVDDQAETILLRVSRGTSLKGLGAMHYDVQMKGFRIIRPLLDLDRMELRSYLRSHGIAWVEDSSNQSMEFLRNRMRHQVLPLLKNHFNPNINLQLTKLAHEAQDIDRFLEDMSEQAWLECTGTSKRTRFPMLQVGSYKALDRVLQNRIALRFLRASGVPESGLSRNAVNALQYFIDEALPTWNFPGNILIKRRRDILQRIQPAEEKAFRIDLALPGRLVIEELGMVVDVVEAKGRYHVYPLKIGTYPQEAYIAKRSVKNGLFLRSWEPGDRISPLGMVGRKKIQDVFTDEKVPREDRKTIPLFCSGNQVLWIPGYAVDRKAGVEDFSEPSWHIKLHPLEEYENAPKY